VLVAQVRLLGRPDQQDLVRRHLGDPGLDDAGVQAVRSALVDSGALAAVESMIEARADQARQALDRLTLREPAAAVLAALVEIATDRHA
jgi:geranylgeranyl diphosphate synthase type I